MAHLPLGTVIRRNRIYFLLIAVWLIGGGIVNLVWDQQTLFFAVNGGHTALRDPLFYLLMPWITWIGDGLFFGTVLLLLLFIRLRLALIGALTLAVSGIIVQVCKQFIFTGYLRPYLKFRELGDIALVEGYTPYTNNSFPSGHATTAFALMTLLALIVPSRWAGALFFITALLTSYSRVYLAQHHLIDIYAGSLLGTAVAVILYSWLNHPEGRLSRGIWTKPLHRLTP